MRIRTQLPIFAGCPCRSMICSAGHSRKGKAENGNQLEISFPGARRNDTFEVLLFWGSKVLMALFGVRIWGWLMVLAFGPHSGLISPDWAAGSDLI